MRTLQTEGKHSTGRLHPRIEIPARACYRIARSEVHGQLITQARDEALRIMQDNPKLDGEHGDALRCLLYLYERDEAIPLIGAG